MRQSTWRAIQVPAGERALAEELRQDDVAGLALICPAMQ
jgi:hypothetical protein